MYVLVAISIVAFLALIWATVAIVIHVREAGRMKAAAAETELREQSGIESNGIESNKFERKTAEQASEEPVVVER
jgi:hypothetical protein